MLDVGFAVRCVIAGIVLCGAARGAPAERTLVMDAVELVAGREVEGRAELSIEREGIEYRFASAESRAAFEASPEKFEVWDGGACGRMGPLSGLGDARRYAVHEGRIFFFASDGCRAGFLQDPARFIEREDEKIFGSHERVQAGRAALDRMVAWMGGADRLRAVSAFRASAARKEMQGEKEWAVTNETAIAFPGRYSQREAWNESWFSTASTPEGGAMASAQGVERIAVSRCRAFNRVMARWPIVIARAHVDGAPVADCPGLIVIGDGEGELDGAAVEFVRVWLNGAASRLTIEKTSGRLMQLGFHGRESSMKVGEAARRYTAYATVDGITLPVAYSVKFDGKDLPGAAGKIDSFEINPELAPDVFRVPEWAGR